MGRRLATTSERIDELPLVIAQPWPPPRWQELELCIQGEKPDPKRRASAIALFQAKACYLRPSALSRGSA